MLIENVVLDLDSTLLNSDKSISDADKRTLEHLSDKGVNIICNTGRHFSYAEPYISSFNSGFPSVFCSGALIYDTKTGIIKKSWKLNNKTKEEIIQIINRFGFSFMAQSESFVYHSDDRILNNLRKCNLFSDLDSYFVDYKEGTLVTDALRLVVHLDPDKKEDFLNALPRSDDYECAMSGVRHLDITAKGINKGSALMYMAENYGLDLNRTLVFGDNENDSPMFDVARYKCCPDNAIDELKKKADFVSCSNNNSAISFAINNFFKEKF